MNLEKGIDRILDITSSLVSFLLFILNPDIYLFNYIVIIVYKL